MMPVMISLMGFGPKIPNASCKVNSQTAPYTIMAGMSAASCSVRSIALPTPPRSTHRLKPTLVSALSVSRLSALATAQPISRIAMNANASGMNVITAETASPSASTIWSNMSIILASVPEPPGLRQLRPSCQPGCTYPVRRSGTRLDEVAGAIDRAWGDRRVRRADDTPRPAPARRHGVSLPRHPRSGAATRSRH
jgi:hypothetical protein